MAGRLHRALPPLRLLRGRSHRTRRPQRRREVNAPEAHRRLLKPTSGSVEAAGEVGYLPQKLTLQSSTTIADLLGITPIVDAINAVEAGDVRQELFDVIGDDWDVEARAAELLDHVGFGTGDLERRVFELSGGEAMLLAVTGLRVRRSPITLLDEPTNNLDRPTRARLSELVDQWPGALVVVSHDLGFLERLGIDIVVEMESPGRLARRADLADGPRIGAHERRASG